jgi:Transposase DDE domain
MIDFDSLEQKFAANLDWHGARIKFLARFLAALITTRTVNLAQIACVFAGDAQPDSHYERCRRFLKDFALPYGELAQFIVAVLGVKDGWTLAVDRTNWKLGQAELNFLVLAIVHQGTAYPVVWFLLDKAGNSHTDERILLLELFLGLFAKEHITTLVADREFVGKAWLAWLTNAQLPFQIRVKEGFQATYRGRHGALRDWFRSATPARPLVLKRPCQMWGAAYYLSGCRLPTGEYLILVAPTYEPAALAQYAQRWGIETLFAALKTRGFNLEDTHVTKEDRLQKLFALLALAFAWCHQVGSWLHEQQPLKKKKHGRLPRSHFRRGLDCLRRLFTQGTQRDPLRWQQVLRLLPDD